MRHSYIFVFMCALLAGIFLAFATAAYGIREIDDPKLGRLFIWTTDEMDKIESALQDLIAERDALRRRLEQLRKACT